MAGLLQWPFQIPTSDTNSAGSGRPYSKIPCTVLMLCTVLLFAKRIKWKTSVGAENSEAFQAAPWIAWPHGEQRFAVASQQFLQCYIICKAMHQPHWPHPYTWQRGVFCVPVCVKAACLSPHNSHLSCNVLIPSGWVSGVVPKLQDLNFQLVATSGWQVRLHCGYLLSALIVWQIVIDCNPKDGRWPIKGKT